MTVHDGRKRRPSDGSQSDGTHHDNYSVLNPFAAPQSGNIRNRRERSHPTYPSGTAPTESSVYVSVHDFNSNFSSTNSEPPQRSSTQQSHRHFLEMESSPSRSASLPNATMNIPLPPNARRVVPKDDDADLLGTGFEPMRTQSGLLLTHRQTPLKNPTPLSSTHSTAPPSRPSHSYAYPSTDRIPPKKSMEMDWGYYNDDDDNDNYSPRGRSKNMTLDRAKRMLSITKVWIVTFCLILIIGSAAVWHSSHHEGKTAEVNYMASKSSSRSSSSSSQVVDKIILVPMPSNATHDSPLSSASKVKPPLKGVTKPTGIRRALRDLRSEFDEWVVEHEKSYHSHDEKEKRFHIWSANHHKTIAKNERHGPCRMTKEPVFGSNMFKDLTPQEFQSRYLTGYHGPKTDELHAMQQKQTDQQHRHHTKMRQTSPGSGLVLDAEKRGGPLHAVKRHSKVQEKYAAKLKEDHERNRNRKLGFSASYSGSCAWYDVSCWLRWFVNTYGYRIGGTMEPAYDSDSYPSAVDWRDMGVVSDIHSQGNCGACWAITGVETVESAYAINKGTLLDLAETEVIICDDTCDMCEGGWPQNAYEYVMEHNGLPVDDSMTYDGDYLLALTYAKNGESDQYSSDYYTEAVQNTCPSGGGNSNSNDNNNGGSTRYGKLKGYGYTTDRCICYTDGTGCDCDEQNEKLAVMNVATYGPATVCLEASLWQDYAGGIITSELGCSSAFLDMNHCVQAVGYAYTDGNGDAGDDDQSGSGSGSNDSKDDSEREGYWIIRNQWSESWGMYGYAYVAMGGNTCGVLNDMTHVYMN